jgi:hypothetical protein
MRRGWRHEKAMSSRLTIKHETRFDASWTSPSIPETLHGCCASELCNILAGKHGVELTQVCFALQSRPKTQSYMCIDPVATPCLDKAWYDRVIDLVRDGSINTSMGWIGRPDIHFGRAASSSGNPPGNSPRWAGYCKPSQTLPP